MFFDPRRNTSAANMLFPVFMGPVMARSVDVVVVALVDLVCCCCCCLLLLHSVLPCSVLCSGHASSLRVFDRV